MTTMVNGIGVLSWGADDFKYAAAWLTEHNRRGTPTPTGLVVSCDEPKVSGSAVTLNCTASGPNPIKGYHLGIAGPSSRDETLPGGPRQAPA